MSLRKTIETIRSNPTPPNEETAKVQILVPILRDLGWDPFGPEVLWEYSVGETKSGGRVDIALTADGRTRALIEAKAPGANLDNHVKQVLGYAFEDGARRHPDDFDRAVEPLKRGKWQYVSRDRGRVRGTNIKQTPSGHYVDVNLSARDIRERVVRLLEALGHRESDLEYLYE